MSADDTCATCGLPFQVGEWRTFNGAWIHMVGPDYTPSEACPAHPSNRKDPTMNRCPCGCGANVAPWAVFHTQACCLRMKDPTPTGLVMEPPAIAAMGPSRAKRVCIVAVETGRTCCGRVMTADYIDKSHQAVTCNECLTVGWAAERGRWKARAEYAEGAIAAAEARADGDRSVAHQLSLENADIREALRNAERALADDRGDDAMAHLRGGVPGTKGDA